MPEEILVNVTSWEARIAVVENGILQDLVVERQKKRGLVGNIYLGRIVRVLPGMQAAFVEIGLDRTAFLHISDIVDNSAIPPSDEGPQNVLASITIDQLLKEGQEILVQIIKEPLGTKGARLSAQLCIPSRYLVFMPKHQTIAISQKIQEDSERERLRDLIRKHRSTPAEEPETIPSWVWTAGPELNTYHGAGGYIVRTAAAGCSEDMLQMDMDFLRQIWSGVQHRLRELHSPCLVYEDLPLVLRTVRSLLAPAVDKIYIDDASTYQLVLEFAEQYIPDLVGRIEQCRVNTPIFDLYGIEDEIQKALEKKVELKSGGHLVIEQTEAMTTIDVNTGGFVGHHNLEETIFKTNLEAAQAIARQLRLRNLGGIIIIDFIDMADPEHQRQIIKTLEKYLDHDHARITVSKVSSIGLVQITRQRTRESLEHVLCSFCPACQGRGFIKTPETVCYEIFREIIRENRQYEPKKFLVLAAQRVIDRLLEEEAATVADLETIIGRTIKLKVDPLYNHEQFDVIPL